MIVASDGVWDTTNFDTIARVALASSNAAEAAEAVVHKAMRPQGLMDDTTCIVAVSAERVAAASSEPSSVEDDRQSSGKSRGSKLRMLMRMPMQSGLWRSTQQDLSVKGGKLFADLCLSQNSDDTDSSGTSQLDNPGSPVPSLHGDEVPLFVLDQHDTSMCISPSNSFENLSSLQNPETSSLAGGAAGWADRSPKTTISVPISPK